MGESAVKQESVERLKRLLGFLERDPRNLQLVSDAAETALAAGDAVQAKQLIQRGLELAGGDNTGARFGFGNLLLAAHDYPAARALFDEMTAVMDHPAVRYNLAYAQFAEGMAVEALETLRQIPESQRTELPQYDLLLGKSLYYSLHYEMALEPLDRYLQKAPDDREGLALKAMVLFDAGQSVAAAALAKRVLGAFPDDLLAHLVLGSIALHENDPVSARAHLQQVVTLQPENGRAWSGLAFTDLRETKLVDARDHFVTAVRYMPNHLGTWHGLAWTQLLLGDLEAARAAATSAMELDRTFSENHGTLAVILIMDGRLDDAEQAIKRGLRLNPQSAASLYARGLLLGARGDAESGKKLIERIYVGAGMQKDAVRIAEALIQFRPGMGQVPVPVVERKAGGPSRKPRKK